MEEDASFLVGTVCGERDLSSVGGVAGGAATEEVVCPGTAIGRRGCDGCTGNG